MYHFAWTQIHFLIFKVLMFSIWLLLLLLAADKIKFEHFIYFILFIYLAEGTKKYFQLKVWKWNQNFMMNKCF